MTSQENTAYDIRKAVWDGIEIDQWDSSKWKQWKPKHPASDRCASLEREYLRIKHAVKVANSALSLDRVKIRLKLTSSKSIGLQGSFPCKPGEVGKNGSPNKQYIISLGLAANDVGIKAAVTKARELDLLLITKQFQWTAELLGKQAQKLAIPDFIEPPKNISTLIQEYEQEFWKTHEANRQGIRTWESHYLRHLKKLPQDTPLSNEALEATLKKTKPNTNSRFFLVWQLKKFCEYCEFDGIKIINSYATPQPTPNIRFIPSDEEIIAGFKIIGEALSPYATKENITLPLQWQWAYGMLATYGLRPHELFAVDLQAYLDPANHFHLVILNPSLTQGTKTGDRMCGIAPLHPQWVELFDLKNVKIPFNGGTLSNQTAKIQIRFRNTGIGFQPYDLRHAYALRGHRLRVPIKTMADYMGHTVQEHTDTYQRWMSQDANLEIYKEVVLQGLGMTKEGMKERIKELEAENLALKAENATLKELLTKHRLDSLFN